MPDEQIVMPEEQNVFIPDNGPLKGREQVLTLRERHDNERVLTSLRLTEPVFLRNIDHAQFASSRCSTTGVVEARVAVGVAEFDTSAVQANTPLVAMWHHQCGCARVWIGVRGADKTHRLMRQVLMLVPRHLTVRDRLEIGRPIELLIVGDYDPPRYRLERLFREFTLPAEIAVSVAETGAEAVEWMESGRRSARPVLLVRDAIRSEPSTPEATLEGSLALIHQIGLAAAFVAWYPGRERSQSDVPLLDAGYARFWDRSWPREALIMMVLDAAGVPGTTTDI